MKLGSLLILSLAASRILLPGAETKGDPLYQAIRADDVGLIEKLIAKGSNVNAADARKATPLMHAAEIGSVRALKVLLAAGADVKAKNAFDVNALMWAIGNPEKVKLLVEAGADVNARSKQGRTPLLMAANNPGSIETARLLVAKGADPKARDEMSTTTLMAAADADELAMIRLFVKLGVDANASDKRGSTALMDAASRNNVEAVKLLLSKGADVNAATKFGGMVKNGPIALTELTPLLLASAYGSPELIRTLLDAGAKVNCQDGRGMTPLMLAVASEHQNLEVVRLLLARGADAKLKSKANETAADWARKFSEPAVLALLDASGPSVAKPEPLLQKTSAVETATLRSAVEKSLPVLQRSSTEFFKQSGCVGCHHQNLTAIAVDKARAQGIAIDEAAAAEQLKTHKAQWTGFQELLLQRIDAPGSSDMVVYSMLGMAAGKYPADSVTDAMLLNTAWMQRTDGSWSAGGISRSPIEESDISRTALAVRAIRLYTPAGLKTEMEQRVAGARTWLLAARPHHSDDQAGLLLGLHWAGAPTAALKAAAAHLLAAQQPDGGWKANAHLDSNPYATAVSLFALRETGMLSPADQAYQRGAAFLIGTQRPDGTWYVQSRAPKFQPYFESGFPYSHDQWISASATAWAAAALAMGLDGGEKRVASN